jgi:hypothetical protein
MENTLAMSAVDFGDVPTWLGVVFASIAGYVALRLYRVEIRRDQRVEVEINERALLARRSQAATVCAWFQARSAYGPLTGLYQSEAESPVWGVEIRNGSNLPVYDVRVAYHFVKKGATTPEKGFYKVAILPPGESFRELPRSLRDAKNPDEMTVALTFRDAAGYSWSRGTDGVLTELVGASMVEQRTSDSMRRADIDGF